MNHHVINSSCFRVAWCAFLVFIFIFTMSFTPITVEAAYKKITVEVRPDTVIEIDGEQVGLKDPLLFHNNKFYMSIKSWDFIQNHRTKWNRPRNVLEVNPYETPVPDDEPATTPKKNSSSNNNNNNTNNSTLNKNTPRPSGFAFKTPTPLPKVNNPQATKGNFLFQTATPIPTPGANNGSSGSNQNGGNGASGNSNGTGNGNGGGATGDGGNSNQTSSVTPKPSPTLKPTPKRNVIPVTSGTPFPVKFGKIMNYQFTYLDKSVPIGSILYKDSLFIRQRDVKDLEFDWTNVPVFYEEVTKEPLILIDELKNRLVDLPQTSVFSGPIISKQIPSEKLPAITIFLEQYGVVSKKPTAADTNFFKWIQPTTNRNEFVAYAQNERNGDVTEYIFTVSDGISGNMITRIVKIREIK